MSKIEVDTIAPQSGTTVTLGESGDTVNIPSGVTLTNSGTATGFGISWQSDIKTSAFTAVAGEGYWINTTSAAITVTLPASASVGDTIEFTDYARTWGTNNLTLNPNSLNYQGNSSPNPVYNVDGQHVRIVYSGATQGWIPTVDDDVTLETPQTVTADFLVVAGGGGGGALGGGGGAGGYRNSYSTESSGGGGSSETSLSLSIGETYTITVGAGGSGGPGGPSGSAGTSGNDSSISGTGITTITSIGGGRGSGYPSGQEPEDGGSGGGGNGNVVPYGGGSGTANQGFKGGDGNNSFNGGSGGGGGASAAATNVVGTSATNGGDGLSSSITGSAVSRGGGGGGGAEGASSFTRGLGGTGGGGNGSANDTGDAGTVNTGGGGGGGGYAPPYQNGGAGGSGVVILRVPTANYTGTTTGSPTVSADGTDTVMVFNASGSYTA
jgi:hypothetical protein